MAPAAPQTEPTAEPEAPAAEDTEATEAEVLAALQSKLNANTSTIAEDETPETSDAVGEEDETQFEAEPPRANEEEATETTAPTYGYDPGITDEGEDGISYTAPEEPSSVTDFDESGEEATTAEVPNELVDEEPLTPPTVESSVTPIANGVVALIVRLYEAISPLESNELEALNILLGNHTDTEVVEVIESIVSDTDRTKSLLDTVAQLSAVDTSDSTKAAVRYTMLLFRYDETTLRNLATVLGVDGLGDDATTEDIVETLATTLASTPAAVFNVAKTINSIIP